jgi:hypothetical protein
MLGLLAIVVIVCLAYIVFSLAPVYPSGKKGRLYLKNGPIKEQPVIIIMHLDDPRMMETMRQHFNSRLHRF